MFYYHIVMLFDTMTLGSRWTDVSDQTIEIISEFYKNGINYDE